MSHVEEIDITSADTPSVDAFMRWRTSNPATVFDSKQVFNNQPQLWDDAEASGGGTGSTYNQNRASTTLDVSNTTAGKRVRQTFQSLNYQPGKSQLIYQTFILGTAASGITREVGQLNNNNGIFLRQDGSGLAFGIRSFVSGAPVDTMVAQANWNVDKLDGTGPSQITLDPTKVQILCIDYEWLASGRVRVGFIIGGKVIIAHEFLHSNVITSVYMSTPNLPLRYSIENDGTGPAATFETICATVISEGGDQPIGLPLYLSLDGAHINANVVGDVYAVLGVRLKTAAIGCRIDFDTMSLLDVTNDNFEWFWKRNPTVNGGLSYAGVTDSCVEFATGDIVGNPSTTTVTGGFDMNGSYVKGTGNSSLSSTNARLQNAIRLGASIAGVRDEFVLCVKPLTINLDIHGGVNLREVL